MIGFQDVNTTYGKPWPAYVLSVNNFGIILKNKMAAIANCLKIIELLVNQICTKDIWLGKLA